MSHLEDMGVFQSKGLAAFEVSWNQDCKDVQMYACAVKMGVPVLFGDQCCDVFPPCSNGG